FVSLVGKAGTGKTLLALAVGLYKTLDESKFQRLLVSRPIFPMGRDIGYLPGDIEQKLNPWMQPVFDNVEFLMGADKKASGRVQELINQGMLNIEPLTYIRGRSIPNQYLIVDEAQNLSPHEIKTIVTRAGRGTKVVLTGDCYQIDNPYVDSASSGLTYSVEKFKGQQIAAHVTLTKGERSQLAELAANIL
ncbi:MAG: PhoH family protein, partial [Pseudomonadota bacterium]|nr:PhoH family protein [Pseudomonadota bacterium]